MGNARSFEVRYTQSEILEDTFEVYRGLESQIEASFKSMDTTNEGKMSLRALEPVVRHHLLQLGLMEYVTRLVDDDGTLDNREIEEWTRAWHIPVGMKIDVHDWKAVVVAWIRRVQEIQAEDVESWQKSLDTMQTGQAKLYERALDVFETAYVKQLEGYYTAVEEEYAKEEEFRRQLEAEQQIQDELHATQMKFLETQNELAALAYEQRTTSSLQKLFADKLLEAMKKSKIPTLSGASQSYTFIYPASLTPSGAPISGGAAVPRNRVARRKK